MCVYSSSTSTRLCRRCDGGDDSIRVVSFGIERPCGYAHLTDVYGCRPAFRQCASLALVGTFLRRPVSRAPRELSLRVWSSTRVERFIPHCRVPVPLYHLSTELWAGTRNFERHLF